MLLFRRLVLFLSAATCFIATAATHAAEIELLAVLSIPGDSADLSGLTELLDGNVPHNQLGGFSAIAYTGKGNRYIVVPDRGPSDGAVPYFCRFHEVELTVDPAAKPPLAFRLLATHLLKDERGRQFNGNGAAFDRANPAEGLRFDPEGVRVGSDGQVYLSDEYGPYLFAFSASGQLERRYPTPAHLLIEHPSAKPAAELSANRSGRQANRGAEGLALSPDGQRLYAMLQGPLLQDQPFDQSGERLGRLVRLVEINRDDGQSQEFVYVLEQASLGISEILEVDAERFLVLERDGKAGSKAKYKRLYLADFAGASDVSNIASLPAVDLPSGVRALKKSLFLDLLDPRFGLKTEQIPEKVEGIAFGPDLADGRKLLIVCTDNDFVPSQPTQIYAFAVAPGALAARASAEKSASLSERVR